MRPPPRRKKWTEAEERTLIDKYGEMVCQGTLVKMKTREKKYKPIALHVNSVHHVHDPVSFPWQWSWKDVSTKVQNMRHQYSLVKQKIKKGEGDLSGNGEELFDWVEGLTHWSNFLRYKEVFGDVDLVFNNNGSMVDHENDGNNHGMELAQFGHLDQGGDGHFAAGIDGVENGVLGLEFHYDGEEREENYNGNNSNNNDIGNMKEDANNGFVYEDTEPMGSTRRKKRKILKGMEKRAWGFLENQLGQLREMEARFEQREVEREQKRQRRENLQMANEQEHTKKLEDREKEREEREQTRDMLRRQRIREWEAMEKESEEREKRRQDYLMHEREAEERMNKRRSEWMKMIDEMLGQHRAEMGQIHNRILHEQQNLTSQLIGIVSQWNGHPAGLSDHTGATNHYLSHMMQNLHHMNGIVHGDTRIEGDAQDDQFIVVG